MALHSSLPIYKVAYDLLRTVTTTTRNMPRDYKQSIGGEIRAECVAITVLIFRANVADDKVPYLGKASPCREPVVYRLRWRRMVR